MLALFLLFPCMHYFITNNSNLMHIYVFVFLTQILHTQLFFSRLNCYNLKWVCARNVVNQISSYYVMCLLLFCFGVDLFMTITTPQRKYIYIYILLFFLHICPLLIPLHNTAVLIKICRFLINLVKFTQTLTKFDLPTLRKCQIFYLLRCFLSSMLPLRSVGRSNFVRVCVNLTTLIQNTTYFNENCCIIYIFIYMFVNMNIFVGISICHYV